MNWNLDQETYEVQDLFEIDVTGTEIDRARCLAAAALVIVAVAVVDSKLLQDFQTIHRPVFAAEAETNRRAHLLAFVAVVGKSRRVLHLDFRKRFLHSVAGVVNCQTTLHLAEVGRCRTSLRPEQVATLIQIAHRLAVEAVTLQDWYSRSRKDLVFAEWSQTNQSSVAAAVAVADSAGQMQTLRCSDRTETFSL